MIYIETDDDELCGEMLASYNERKTINLCGKDIAMSQISRNVLVSGGVSVAVKGGICAKPTWIGNGKPPVGIDCEYMKRGGAEWVHCTVIAEHDGGVVVAVHEGDLSYSYWKDSGHFRPIRTPQQIADDERNSEITFMASCIAHSGCRNAPTGNDIAAAAHLHYLGYRKP